MFWQQAAARLVEEENAVSFCSTNLYFVAALSFLFFYTTPNLRARRSSVSPAKSTSALATSGELNNSAPPTFCHIWLHFRRVAVLDFLNSCKIYGTGQVHLAVVVRPHNNVVIDSCHGLRLGHGSRVMRVTGQLTDGSRGSWVTKWDPLSALWTAIINST